MNRPTVKLPSTNLILLFVDGLGLAEPAASNPVNSDVCPTLCRLIEQHSVPLDACLGVPGLPQSATGQAALFTGVNVPGEIGWHMSGFPGPRVRSFVEAGNLFLTLMRLGVSCKFANSFYNVTMADVSRHKYLRSVTTVMAMTVPATISFREDLYTGRAVTQDLTRHCMKRLVPDEETIEPEEAAQHLVTLARDHGLTLFEYFQTDRVGHSLDYAKAADILTLYDRFLTRLMELIDFEQTLLVLTSDHGNIEAMDIKTHTFAPVPLIAYGVGAGDFLTDMTRLTDVTPRIVATLAPQNPG